MEGHPMSRNRVALVAAQQRDKERHNSIHRNPLISQIR
jgi:hypothetical protein